MKKKQPKKQPKPGPAPQPSAPASAPSSPSTTSPTTPEAVADSTALAQLAALTTADVTCPPWPNKRIAIECPLCHETHASPVSYIGRLVRRGSATADEIRWLREHLTASGIQIPA